MYGVLPETTGRTRSHTNACSGSGKRRGCSAAHASRTTPPAGPGTERACAGSAIQGASWALRSLREAKRRGGEKGGGRERGIPSTLPLSFPRDGAQGGGAEGEGPGR